jgi:murein L,D-transpeptidase YcbB/YkuD
VGGAPERGVAGLIRLQRPTHAIRRDTGGTVGLSFVGLVMLLLFSGAAAGVMATRTSTPTQTTIDPRVARERAEVTARFFKIMSVREQALSQRNLRALNEIYTPDSPQLHKDRTEIQTLRRRHELWRGLQLPVQILKVTQASSRRWTVVALLGRSDARLELESGELIRDVEGNRQVYWCTLIKDPAKGWLLYKFVPP